MYLTHMRAPAEGAMCRVNTHTMNINVGMREPWMKHSDYQTIYPHPVIGVTS